MRIQPFFKYGEISKEFAEYAEIQANCSEVTKIISFCFSLLCLCVAVGLLVAGCKSVGAAFSTATACAMYVSKRSEKNETAFREVHIAYMQRHQLKKLGMNDI